MESRTSELLINYFLGNGEFAALDNNEDRAKFAVKILSGNGLGLPNYVHEFKSTSKSEMFRDRGNATFNSQSRDLVAALELYTKSIVHALPGTLQLSLAYGNRSAVLFEGKYYEDCLADIDRALQIGYPEDLKPKLLIRKVKCTYALTGYIDFEKDEMLMEARSLVESLPATNKIKKMVEDITNNPGRITSIARKVGEERSSFNFMPKIEEEHPHLPGASSAIALKYSKRYGRHIVATRDIKSGEALVIEKPYIAIVEPESIYSICTHCTERTWNCLPCDHCVNAVFCSEECKQAAWSEYHDIECEIIETTIGLKMRQIWLVALRLTIKSVKEAGTLENLKHRLKILDSFKESDVEIPIKPISYETFYIMSDNCEKKTPDELLEDAIKSVLITYYLATRTELFGEKLICNLEDGNYGEWFPFVAGLLSKNFRIAKIRMDDVATAFSGEPRISVAAILLPISSFFNHRCYGYVVAAPLSNKSLAICTVSPVKAGNQIFISYGADFKTIPKEDRVSYHQKQFNFLCDCLACKNDWSQFSCIPIQNQHVSVETDIEARALAVKMLISLKHENDYVDVARRLKQYSELMNVLYPAVQAPCFEVEEISQEMIYLYENCSGLYPPFNKKN